MDAEVVEASSKYFISIDAALFRIQLFDRNQVLFRKKVHEQLDVLIMDVRFLTTLSMWLEKWAYTGPGEVDEESMENLRSILTCLKLIWPKQLKALSLLNPFLTSTPPDEKWMQDFHSATFELEAIIQQTKGQVEGWTQFLMRSSLQYWVFRDFHLLLGCNNVKGFFKYKAAEIVPLKQQTDILKAKIVFMDDSWYRVDCMAYGEKMLPLVNFICDFANTATCLTCLYWAKESNEMNILLFDMLHKFLPFSSDIITALYTVIQKSYDLQDPSDSILLGEALESCVDFFFNHLTNVLKDDYLILRDRLIFLFTFLLTDPPREINAQEEDLIRNQIYALVREEDAFLLLPFDEMKKDFSDKKMLLNDCMIKIDITVAKVRQLYYGSSDSWLKLEVEKMEYIYFVSVHRELYWLEKHASWADPVIDQLQLYGMELRFLRVFLLCFAAWDDSDKEINIRLRSLISSFQEIWEKEEEKSCLPHRLHAIRAGDITHWQPLASELEKKIQLLKLEIKARWVNLFHWLPLTSHEILKCLDSIIECLNDLVSYKAHEIISFKKQIETLGEKLVFLKNFLKLATKCIHGKQLEEFKLFVQVFVKDAICLTFLYWAKDTNEKSAFETNNMLSHMLQKIKPATPHVARLYFGTLNAIYAQRSDSLMFGQTALTFVDFFLEDPVIPLKNEFQILRDDIVFLLSFLNDPPNQNAEEVICSQIDVLFWEGVYGLLPFDDMEGDFFDKRALLSDFMMKIEMINANIRRIYGKFPDPSGYNFPKIISPRFLDNLIQDLINLKERMISDRKYAPFAKYKITKIGEELVSLRPFFNYIFDMRSELNKTWLEVVDFVHLTEHIINSSISSWFVFDHPIWYHMAHLSDIIDGIKVVKTKLEKIKENTMYNATCPPLSTSFTSTFSEQARPSEMIETIVGFEDEAEKIMGMLMRGSESLDIVSIVGMGGLGKTTLAKKVYGSSLVKSNFNLLAFCSVSQDHNARRLLLDIICDTMGDDKRWSSGMTDDDLAHQLWKSLSRRKFLIVLDDIWNASAWNDVKSSFPDDKNGSRVMLTTRSHEVADKCKIKCSPYQLCFMSEVESWELLQKKVFHNVISPPYLYEVGKRIAKNCKGLPLAVVVIAGLLARTEKCLSWWSEVAERVVSYLSEEGCMRILELSYNHLPETLKPCLLYLGAFPEDEKIRVKKVILLWIAEGFVQESKTKCIEDVAKEYLHDLLDRNLIIVSERSSIGEIKEIRVHDLIHDLCQTKCREANFFQLNHKIASSSSPDLSINNHCRVSMRNQSDLITVAGSSVSNVRSLLLFSEHLEEVTEFRLRKLRLVQVLDSDLILRVYGKNKLSSLIHLRHIYAKLLSSASTFIPQSICNIWNIGSLTLKSFGGPKRLPETFWRMKSLRHVKVGPCILKFSDGQEHEAYPKLDKVVSFSNPEISNGKDVQWLLGRLPAVRKLSCCLKNSPRDDEESPSEDEECPSDDEESPSDDEESPSDNEESVEILDFHRKLESLKLSQSVEKRKYLIHFPPTLKKLTLDNFDLLWTDISAIAELHCLQVLKLIGTFIQEERLEMEDLVFRNLKFFELHDYNLVEWNASTESLPCLEQLVIKHCAKLEEFPPCFGEISTLKRIDVRYASEKLRSSAFRILEEQMELGIKVEVEVLVRHDNRSNSE